MEDKSPNDEESKSDDYYDPRSRLRVCPEHLSPMDYWPASRMHACLDPNCRYARGYEPVAYEEASTWADQYYERKAENHWDAWVQDPLFTPSPSERAWQTIWDNFPVIPIRRGGVEFLPKGNEVTLTGSTREAAWARSLERIQRGKDADCVAIVSGGLDSTTLVYHLLTTGYTPHLLSFDYGQRHKKELQYAKITARNLGLRHDIVDLTGITHLISNSALTSPRLPEYPTAVDLLDVKPAIEVPEGHYAEETMKQTVVPNRNMIMLSVAAGVAVNNSYKLIATGVHAGDHFIYPDCRPRFINAATAAILAGNQGFGAIPEWAEGAPLEGSGSGHDFIYAPFLHVSKADIAYRALELGVPLHMTWSCYKGGDIHCGRCGTCVERLEAIDEATKRFQPEGGWKDFRDQTEYEDTEFWKTSVREAKSDDH